MKPEANRPTSRIIGVIFYTACLLLLLYATLVNISLYRLVTRGVDPRPMPAPATPSGSFLGTNVRLHEEPDIATQSRLLRIARQSGLGWVRQRFPWADIEPEHGHYNWAPWDHLVTVVQEEGLSLIAVVDTSPAWARSNDVITSPPDNYADYARFLGQLATRYRGRVAAYQIWDEPNIRPHWGPRYASPREYTALLRAAAAALRAADAQAVILAGGLAPTIENTEWNQSDIAFLQGMYKAGAQCFFDALAAKPYGFWSGPEDRRVDANVLNFSRVILLRETMERYGDGQKPIWAVEMGWNALPADWSGQPSPWGTDSEERQAQRTLQALRRARAEWGWLPVLILPALRYPAAGATDPVRGFALLNDDLSPRMALNLVAIQAAAGFPLQGEQDGELAWARQVRERFPLAAILLLAALSAVGWRLARLVPGLPWQAWARSFLLLPEWLQLASLSLATAVFFFTPWLPVRWAISPLILALVYLRLDLGLLATAFAVPFSAQPRRVIGTWEFSMLEVLIVLCTISWLARQAVQRRFFIRRLDIFDASVLALFGLSLASLMASADVHLSLRELRTVIFEPVLLYLLIRSEAAASAPLSDSDRLKRYGLSAKALYGEALIRRLAISLVLGATIAALWGLYQYAFTSQVITAEGGLRRMLGPYPSPNALGLLLERALPLGLALAVAHVTGKAEPPRLSADPAAIKCWGWLLALLAMALGLFLTFSVGAWMGAAVGCIVVIACQPRWLAIRLAMLVIAAGLLATPVLRTERVSSHFNLQSASTSMVRLAVWRSALAMIQDHPWQGVGLDGFLELYRTQYIRPEAWQEPDLSHPHNLVLEAWLSLGIWGPPAILWLLGLFFWRAQRLLRRIEEPVSRAPALGWAGAIMAGVAHGLVDRFLAGAPDLSAILFLALASLAALEISRD